MTPHPGSSPPVPEPVPNMEQLTPTEASTTPTSQPSPQSAPTRPTADPSGPMRHVSVDSVLQGSSDIPSSRPRGPPRLRPLSLQEHTEQQQRQQERQQKQQQQQQQRRQQQEQQQQQYRPHAQRRVASAARGLPSTTSRTGQHVPGRTTKVSEKLVLLPLLEEQASDEDIESRLSLSRRLDEDDDRGPLKDEERDVLRKRGGIRGKSYAERLPKVQRTAEVSRLTAYCTAQAFRMKPMAEFLRRHHGARTKLYDDCMYVIYALPLLPGSGGYRMKSRAILRTPGTGKTVVDLEIERSERGSGCRAGYFDDDFNGNGNGNGGGAAGESDYDNDGANGQHGGIRVSASSDSGASRPPSSPPNPANRFTADAKNFAELFVFSYGVVVFWNFTEGQERDVLADMSFAENDTGVKLATRRLEHDDYETEDFHFEYSSDVKRPRIFNDMITLLPRFDHMVKLTISHAVAQSTKLCFFEERMSETMADAQHVPKDLAVTGELKMGRTEVVKILGRLFKSRVDINLSSNVLDVPKFFWDSEPTLHPLYAAIREYLEIDHRTRVLNDRCRVFLDLAEMLSDSVADSKMSNITWIIIILIAVSIVVTVSEVVLRFSMLEKSRDRTTTPVLSGNASAGEPRLLLGAGPREEVVVLGAAGGTAGQRGDDVLADVRRLVEGMGADELRRWRAVLSAEQMEGICGGAGSELRI